MIDDQLKRLCRAASKAQAMSDDTIPFGFETKVMAHWQSRAEDVTLALFRKALGFACATIAISLALSYHTLNSSPSAELSIANNALEFSYTQ